MRGKRRAGLWSLCLALACGAVSPGQQNPNGQIPLSSMPDPYLLLIRDPLVHRELRLTKGQIGAVTSLTDSLDPTLWSLRNQPADRAAAQLAELTDSARERIKSVWSESQVRRLGQIQRQVAGVRALTRDDVARTLKLSDEQRTKIGELLARPEPDQPAPKRPDNNGGSSERSRPNSPAESDPRQQIWEMLSPQQQAGVRELFGKSYDVSRLGYVKFKAPELSGGDGWLNAKPLTMDQLRGKVVALHFWTFG